MLLEVQPRSVASVISMLATSIDAIEPRNNFSQIQSNPYTWHAIQAYAHTHSSVRKPYTHALTRALNSARNATASAPMRTHTHTHAFQCARVRACMRACLISITSDVWCWCALVRCAALPPVHADGASPSVRCDDDSPARPPTPAISVHRRAPARR